MGTMSDQGRNTWIELTRIQVTSVMYQIGLCQNLESLIAEPDFPFEDMPWTTPLRLTPEQLGRALPLLIELHKLLKLE